MRSMIVLLSIFVLSGCTALAVGGAAAAGYQLGKDERTPSVVASDSAITTKIKGKYVADSIVSVFNISERTWEGTVTLGGTVGSRPRRSPVKPAASRQSTTRLLSRIRASEC